MSVVLGELLDELGPSVLNLVVGHVVATERITSVSYYDPLELMHLPEGAIVLSPGVTGAQSLRELLSDASLRNVVAVVVVVVRSVASAPLGAVRNAAEKGIVVFELTAGYTWHHLAVSLDRILAEDPSRPGPVGSEGSVDLFVLANAAARMLNAPVTIEDARSRVLAFSDDQGRADEARKTTVLARRVSPRDAEFLRSEGYFERIYAEDEVVHVPTEGVGGVLPPGGHPPASRGSDPRLAVGSDRRRAQLRVA